MVLTVGTQSLFRWLAGKIAAAAAAAGRWASLVNALKLFNPALPCLPHVPRNIVGKKLARAKKVPRSHIHTHLTGLFAKNE